MPDGRMLETLSDVAVETMLTLAPLLLMVSLAGIAFVDRDGWFRLLQQGHGLQVQSHEPIEGTETDVLRQVAGRARKIDRQIRSDCRCCGTHLEHADRGSAGDRRVAARSGGRQGSEHGWHGTAPDRLVPGGGRPHRCAVSDTRTQQAAEDEQAGNQRRDEGLGG